MEFIKGRKLEWKEIKSLKEGTKVWMQESEKWEKKGFLSCLGVKSGDRLVKENGKKYDIENVFNEYGLESVSEVCMINEVETVRFEQLRDLEDGTKVFVVDGLTGQWCVKEKTDLKRFDDRYYYIPYGSGDMYSGRRLTMYVHKYSLTEVKEVESVEKTQVEGVEISFSEKEIKVSVNGISAISKCNPDDEFNKNIGLGIALERLGKKLQEIGEREVKEIEEQRLKKDYPLMTIEDFAEFIRGGKVAINCETKEGSEKFLGMVRSLGESFKISSSAWEYRKERTAYAYNFNGYSGLGYAKREWYKEQGYKVVRFQ